MTRELTDRQLIERSVHKKYRKTLWTPFVAAVKRYELIGAGDKIAACLTGDAGSLLSATLLRLLARVSEVPFDVVFLASDSCGDAARACAARLEMPIEGFVPNAEIVEAARTMGCNKLALGTHMNDVVETAMANLLYGGTLTGILPKERAEGHAGIALIRPIYLIEADVVAAWARYNQIHLPDAPVDDDRLRARELMKSLKRDNPDVEKSVFNAVHAVNFDTFPAWETGGESHDFLEKY